jgi:hypothetical protein
MGEPALSVQQPSRWRVVAAFLIAPFVAASIFGVAAPAYAGLPDLLDRIVKSTIAYLLFGAYPTAFLLGVPAFLFLRRRLRPTAVNCALVGSMIASLPWLALGLLSPVNYSYDDGHVTTLNGQKTPWGWIDLATLVGQMAALGLLGGLVFWLVAAARLRRTAPSPA